MQREKCMHRIAQCIILSSRSYTSLLQVSSEQSDYREYNYSSAAWVFFSVAAAGYKRTRLRERCVCVWTKSMKMQSQCWLSAPPTTDRGCNRSIVNNCSLQCLKRMRFRCVSLAEMAIMVEQIADDRYLCVGVFQQFTYLLRGRWMKNLESRRELHTIAPKLRLAVRVEKISPV